jgi:predicted RecA/RadA family phage recombinase
MKNAVQEGQTLTLTAPADVSSGSGVLVGSIFGIAATTAKSGEAVECDVVGVFDIAKTAGQAWATVGLLIYWDNVGKTATTVVGTNKLIGCNTKAAAGADATGRVRLSGAFTI